VLSKKTHLLKKANSLLSKVLNEEKDSCEKRFSELESRIEMLEEENDNLSDSLSSKNEVINRLNKRIAVCEASIGVISSDLVSTLYMLVEIQGILEKHFNLKKENIH